MTEWRSDIRMTEAAERVRRTVRFQSKVRGKQLSNFGQLRSTDLTEHGIRSLSSYHPFQLIFGLPTLVALFVRPLISGRLKLESRRFQKHVTFHPAPSPPVNNFLIRRVETVCLTMINTTFGPSCLHVRLPVP